MGALNSTETKQQHGEISAFRHDYFLNNFLHVSIIVTVIIIRIIIIYYYTKKDSTRKPNSFRPITLQM